jgi:hypothetical protein
MIRNVPEVLNHESRTATIYLGKISCLFQILEYKMREGNEFQGKNMKRESFPSIVNSFTVGKKCCVYDDYSTDVEAVTHTLTKNKESNFVVFCPTIVSYSFMQGDTMTTDKNFRTQF